MLSAFHGQKQLESLALIDLANNRIDACVPCDLVGWIVWLPS